MVRHLPSRPLAVPTASVTVIPCMQNTPQAVGCCRSLGLIVPGASAAIGPRRTLLWSALVVSYRRLGPLRPEAISEVILPRRFWSSVTSDLAMPIAESDRASCCPAGSRGACCDKSGLCQRGSKAEAMVLPPNSL